MEKKILKKSVYDSSLSEMEEFCVSRGFKKYNAFQAMRWLYFYGRQDFDKMTDIPKKLREILPLNFSTEFPEILNTMDEEDLGGRSRKYLLRLKDGETVESVFINYDKRKTLCVSSQAGCRMGCAFCETSFPGLVRNLSSGEIISQVLLIRKHSGEDITNIVFMGMGEPLDNISAVNRSIAIMTEPNFMGIAPRKITISTCGLLDKLEELENKKCKLAISLNASNDRTRTSLMPVNRKYGLEDIASFTKKKPPSIHNKITLEYVMIKGLNDSKADLKELIRMFSPARVKFNLIPLNKSGSTERMEGMDRPENKVIADFKEKLSRAGFAVTVRFSKAQSINGGCGQLKARQKREGNQYLL